MSAQPASALDTYYIETPKGNSVKFQTHNDGFVNSSMTSLQGSIQATRTNIVKAFGLPVQGDEGDKVTNDWSIQFEDGTVATIYDWKSQPFDYNQVYSWRVGGHNQKAVDMVHNAYRTVHSLIARAA